AGRRVEDGGVHERRDRRQARPLAPDGDPQAGDDPRHLAPGADAVNDTNNLSHLAPTELRHINRTCDCFEAVWANGPRPEDYLDATAEPLRSALLRQLLLLDWDYRRRAGTAPTPAEYLARFPGDAALIEAVAREMDGASAGLRAGVNADGHPLPGPTLPPGPADAPTLAPAPPGPGSPAPAVPGYEVLG